MFGPAAPKTPFLAFPAPKKVPRAFGARIFFRNKIIAGRTAFKEGYFRGRKSKIFLTKKVEEEKQPLDFGPRLSRPRE